MRDRGPSRAPAGRRVAALLAAIALAGFCVGASLRQWSLVLRNLEFGSAHMSDSLPVARRVHYGSRFMRGIEAIAAVIPPDGSYWLVDGSDEQAYGFFVRSALAPRQAHYLGRSSWVDQDVLQAILGATPTPFVVLAWQPDGPPALVDPRRFLKSPATP